MAGGLKYIVIVDGQRPDGGPLYIGPFDTEEQAQATHGYVEFTVAPLESPDE